MFLALSALMSKASSSHKVMQRVRDHVAEPGHAKMLKLSPMFVFDGQPMSITSLKIEFELA